MVSSKEKRKLLKELRVGNYVLLSGKMIPFSGVSAGMLELSLIFAHNLDLFEPVPLTEELLVKCGFTKAGDVKNEDSRHEYISPWIKDGAGEKIKRLRLFVDEAGFYPEPHIKLNYLHQLQNWFYWSSGQKELSIKKDTQTCCIKFIS